jgi:hypothetical protein
MPAVSIESRVLTPRTLRSMSAYASSPVLGALAGTAPPGGVHVFTALAVGATEVVHDYHAVARSASSEADEALDASAGWQRE